MKRKSFRKPYSKSSQEQLESMCGQPGSEDGIDPRDFFRTCRPRRNNRKDWQLCRQVFETLNYVLSGDSRDEVLRALTVSEVVPAPDAHRLLVTVSLLMAQDDFNPLVVLERLQQSIGWLRSEVARSISRRKVPELAFRVVLNNPGATPGNEDQHAQ